jgi:transposase
MEPMDTALFLLPEGIALEEVSATATSVTVQMACWHLHAACPQCQSVSMRMHGHYTRTVADLPCAGRRVILHLRVRKFVCATPTCPQRIFTERLTTFVQSYARMTNRLREALVALGMVTGGESGERLAPQLGMCVSAPTLLRRMRQAALPPPQPVYQVGVDDWAWRKGQTYGTILVDLQRHCPIDVLPDRTAATTEAWLRGHPEVELVSRDRSYEYAAAARAGAPQARQVADRFHLLKNLRETLQHMLERKQSVLPEVPTEERCQAIPAKARGHPTDPVSRSGGESEQRYRQMTGQPRLRPDRQATVTEYRRMRREARYARYETVRALFEQGMSLRAIARRLGLSLRTVTRFVRAETFPELVSHPLRPRGSILDPYKAYVRQRCQEGCWNGTQLYAEIQAQGFIGSQPLLRLFLAEVRKQQPAVLEVHQNPRKVSILDPYKPYLLQRWQQGCWNGIQLYEEIRTLGFAGSQPTVRDFLADVRQKQHLVGEAATLQWDATHDCMILPSELPPKRTVTHRMSPAQASWLVFLPTERLSNRQREQRAQVRCCHPEVDVTCTLVSELVGIVKQRQAEALEDWLTRAAQSQIPELQRFAAGVRRDEAAVRAACAIDASNGQVEGQVARLKLLKRQMYGRANLDLLRLRVLHRA